MQSDDLEAANALTFHGVPQYIVQPQTMELLVKDGRLDLELKPYSVYVLQARRGKR
jgi:hypothetical protein